MLLTYIYLRCVCVCACVRDCTFDGVRPCTFINSTAKFLDTSTHTNVSVLRSGLTICLEWRMKIFYNTHSRTVHIYTFQYIIWLEICIFGWGWCTKSGKWAISFGRMHAIQKQHQKLHERNWMRCFDNNSIHFFGVSSPFCTSRAWTDRKMANKARFFFIRDSRCTGAKRRRRRNKWKPESYNKNSVRIDLSAIHTTWFDCVTSLSLTALALCLSLFTWSPFSTSFAPRFSASLMSGKAMSDWFSSMIGDLHPTIDKCQHTTVY